jgi:23S rRNA (uracil1939-C5)-methyltransferase
MQSQAEPQDDLNPPLRVGQLLDSTVRDLSHDGRGVVPIEGGVAFVTGALPGDRVRLRLEHRARRQWQARLEEVLEPSPQRCQPACLLADRCGGCTLQHLEQQGQQRWKRQKVVEALQRIAHIPQAEELVAPLLSAGDGLGYRNRATLPLERRDDGSLRAGYYRTGSHRLVNVNHCPVLDPRLDSLLNPLKHDLETSGWPVDRHLQAEGGLRHLGLRLGHHSGELLVTLVSSHPELPGLERWAERWLERWPDLVGVCLNLQDRATNVLFGPHTQVVAGRGWIEERFVGQSLTVGADTFFQVNTPMAERVVPLMLTALQGQDPGLVVDAYCGIGTFSLPLAAAGWQVLGIELASASVERARLNAERNHLGQQCRFEEGAVGPALAAHLGEAVALLVDPPRKGLDPTALAAILEAPPARLLYLSCDPATLARDLAALAGAEGPYRLNSVQPLDFFPQTSHVEVLVSLERR